MNGKYLLDTDIIVALFKSEMLNPHTIVLIREARREFDLRSHVR